MGQETKVRNYMEGWNGGREHIKWRIRDKARKRNVWRIVNDGKTTERERQRERERKRERERDKERKRECERDRRRERERKKLS